LLFPIVGENGPAGGMEGVKNEKSSNGIRERAGGIKNRIVDDVSRLLGRRAEGRGRGPDRTI